MNRMFFAATATFALLLAACSGTPGNERTPVESSAGEPTTVESSPSTENESDPTEAPSVAEPSSAASTTEEPTAQPLDPDAGGGDAIVARWQTGQCPSPDAVSAASGLQVGEASGEAPDTSGGEIVCIWGDPSAVFGLTDEGAEPQPSIMVATQPAEAGYDLTADRERAAANPESNFTERPELGAGAFSETAPLPGDGGVACMVYVPASNGAVTGAVAYDPAAAIDACAAAISVLQMP